MIRRDPSCVDRNSVRQLCYRWLFGLVVGTLLIAISSPLFVRSYPVRDWDEVRQRWVYPEGMRYRWRSEGYGTTAVGPHGLMGGTFAVAASSEPSESSTTIALWGDSQAEGVCVDDSEKLFTALQNQLPDCHVLPLASSGDDAWTWVHQFPLVEKAWGVDEHVLLLCELEDFEVLAIEPPTQVDSSMPTASHVELARWVPDFVIQAARTVLLDEVYQLRQFRFGIGPVLPASVASGSKVPASVPRTPAETGGDADFWIGIATRLVESSSLPITLVYAPKSPVVMGDRVFWTDDRSSDFEMMSSALRQRGVRVVDCRDALRESAEKGRFPHGFHNGLIGSGHLNAEGYRLIADEVAKAMASSDVSREAFRASGMQRIVSRSRQP
ncbi:hypothetical protein SAMN06265222_101503 [Neorhodopirellula lusitana]|uniref:Uncharacterized protein n=1 Tax=Neorhodopirellula lusitana TaxID=445327 RepID=A0ABY1PP77_9BACT|nr:hypothetical protein SAMN06265222_101503 [Neorhodopirellula lusitana]